MSLNLNLVVGIFSPLLKRMVSVTLSVLQSQFTEKGFKKGKHFQHSVVLLLFLFTLVT